MYETTRMLVLLCFTNLAMLHAAGERAAGQAGGFGAAAVHTARRERAAQAGAHASGAQVLVLHELAPSLACCLHTGQVCCCQPQLQAAADQPSPHLPLNHPRAQDLHDLRSTATGHSPAPASTTPTHSSNSGLRSSSGRLYPLGTTTSTTPSSTTQAAIASLLGGSPKKSTMQPLGASPPASGHLAGLVGHADVVGGMHEAVVLVTRATQLTAKMREVAHEQATMLLMGRTPR